MSKITLTFVLIMTLNMNLICSIRERIEQKKYALILPANFSKYRHELTNEMKIKPKIPPWEKDYDKDCNYCVYFKILKNKECLSNLTKTEVYVLCERVAMDESLICKGDGFYGLHSCFFNLQNNCLGVWKKLNRTSTCSADFIFL